MKSTIWHDATVSRVVDADTLLLTVALGFDVQVVIRARLFAVYAPELRSEPGKAMAARVAEWLTGKAVEIRCLGIDRYGRWLVEVQTVERLPVLPVLVNDVIREWVGTPSGAGLSRSPPLN